ncbi:unnamed protein product [Linum tenue]|uniref:Uncharacterized protein n=1 Tax=Linum tenue TaxID=586396 RepID=A0AAV0IHQ0_9ROSI|nr:unnamed protein product [Linum tenue]
MSVFRLEFDNQFLLTFLGDPDIHVFEYTDDPNVFEMIYDRDDSRWLTGITVGRSPAASFRALEVFGVTIGGNKLKQLAKDLTLVDENGQPFHLLVNRQGLCFLRVRSQSIVRLRINDHFGWSKYGVNPQISTIWSIWDMNNGAVLVAPPANLGEEGIDVDEKKKLLEEKEKLLEEKNKLMEKMLEEKEKEVVSLKAALNALTLK